MFLMNPLYASAAESVLIKPYRTHAEQYLYVILHPYCLYEQTSNLFSLYKIVYLTSLIAYIIVNVIVITNSITNLNSFTIYFISNLLQNINKLLASLRGMIFTRKKRKEPQNYLFQDSFRYDHIASSL